MLQSTLRNKKFSSKTVKLIFSFLAEKRIEAEKIDFALNSHINIYVFGDFLTVKSLLAYFDVISNNVSIPSAVFKF